MRLGAGEALRWACAVCACSWMAASCLIIQAWPTGACGPDPASAVLVLPLTLLWIRLSRFKGIRTGIEALGAVLLLSAACVWVWAYAPKGHAAVLGFFLASIAWVKGWRLGRVDPAWKTASSEAQWGFSALALLLLPSGLNAAPDTLDPRLLCLFLLSALVSLWLGRGLDLDRKSLAAGRGASVVALVLGLGASAGLCWAILSSISKPLLVKVSGPVVWVWRGLGLMIDYLGMLIYAVFSGRKLPQFDHRAMSASQEPTAMKNIPVDSADGSGSILAMILLCLASLAMLAMACYLIARFLNKLKAGAEQGAGRGRPVSAPAQRVFLLKLLWQKALGFYSWISGIIAALMGPRTPLAPERKAFRKLMKWAARQGLRRMPSQTPREFLAEMERALPQHSGDFRVITESYESARFGPGGGENAEGMRQACARVKKSSRAAWKFKRVREGLG